MFVRVYEHGSSVKSPLYRSLRALIHSRSGSRGGGQSAVSCRRLGLGFRACRRHSECAVRCFGGGFAMRVVLVALMELVGLFVGFASEPASDARQRAERCHDSAQNSGSKPAGDVRCRSLIPPVTTTAHSGRIYRETQRKRNFRCVRRFCLATWEFRPGAGGGLLISFFS